MSNHPKDNLLVLIKSLSKSEKRHFKLYVNRLDVNSDAKFLMLFNLLDKMKEYDEALICHYFILQRTLQTKPENIRKNQIIGY